MLKFYSEKQLKERATKALSAALKEFRHYDKHWISRYSSNTNSLLYFFPLDCLNKLGEEKSDFIRIVTKHWRNNGFEVKMYPSFPANNLYEIAYDSFLFSIKLI